MSSTLSVLLILEIECYFFSQVSLDHIPPNLSFPSSYNYTLHEVGVRFPVCLSLKKPAGTPEEKADMLHVATCEQGPSLCCVNTRPSSMKPFLELLELESCVSEDT
jgi:hypothetical protein